VLAACGETAAPDAGTDAGGGDAGATDTGVAFFACKALQCNAAEEHCKIVPVGPCTIMDGGMCAAGQEECVTTGGSGCTPERTPTCEPLAGCTSCACLIARAPCAPGPTEIRCLSSRGTITLECP
jgi:hypothetical protein